VPTTEETTVLSFKYEVDPKAAIQAAKRMQSELSKRLKIVEKNEKNLTTGLFKYIAQTNRVRKTSAPALQKEAKVREQLLKTLSEQREALKKYAADAEGYHKDELAAIQKVTDAKQALEALRKRDTKGEKPEATAAFAASEKELELTIARSKVETEANKKNAENAKKALAITEKQREEVEAGLEASSKKSSGLVNAMRDFPKALPEAAKASGEWLVSPLQDFASKDAPALFKKAFAIGAFAVGKPLLKGAAKAGSSFGLFAQRTLEKAKSREAAGKAGGGMLKAVGGAAGGIGDALKTFSKLGPVIGIMSSFMMSFIKILVDAEAAAKEFNKSILSTAGTAEFLQDNMGNVGAGAADLEGSLGKLRDGAMSWDNVMWGISKDTSVSFMNALTAEGVSLKRLQQEMKSTTGYAKDEASVIQMSVAYSRAWGVSLNEITQLQGEMMTEIGMGLTGVQSSFQYMTAGAEEAGMATNKFFGIIRSFSADLTLFTLRLEDVTQVLMALGKSMSPREAQKFLQTISQTYKGMDLMGRVRATAMGGTKETKDVLQKDLSRRLDMLGKDIGVDITELVKNQKPEDLTNFLAKNGRDMTGAQKSAIWDAFRMQGKLLSGSMIDVASALKDASPMAVIAALQLQSMKMFKKPLEDLTGVERVAAGNAIGQSDEQVDGLFKMKQGVMQVQADMAAKLEKDKALTEAETNAIAKLNIDTKKSGVEQAKALRDLDYADVFAALSSDEQDALKGSLKQIDYQKRISDQQTSVIDRLGMIFDVLMNQIYNVMTGIWKMLSGSKFFGASDFDKLQVAIDQLGNTRLSKAVKGAGGDVGTAKTRMIESVGKDFIRSVQAAVAENKDLQKSLKSATPKEAANIEKRMKELESLTDYQNVTVKDLYAMAGEGGMHEDAKDLAKYLLGQADLAAKVAPIGGVATTTTAAATPATKQPPVAAHQEATTKAVEDTNKALKKGIPLAKPTPAYKKAVTDSTVKAVEKSKSVMTDSSLEAIRKGLFEYYMYSQLDRTQVAKGLKTGAFDATTIGQKVAGGAADLGSPQAALAKAIADAEKAAPKASGGVVASITNGRANLSKLPPGEGWTPIGMGEKILPAGAGGGRGGGNVKVELELKGDLRRFIEARVVEGSAKFEQNKRLH